jgi:hypothetical protein
VDLGVSLLHRSGQGGGADVNPPISSRDPSAVASSAASTRPISSAVRFRWRPDPGRRPCPFPPPPCRGAAPPRSGSRSARRRRVRHVAPGDQVGAQPGNGRQQRSPSGKNERDHGMLDADLSIQAQELAAHIRISRITGYYVSPSRNTGPSRPKVHSRRSARLCCRTKRSGHERLNVAACGSGGWRVPAGEPGQAAGKLKSCSMTTAVNGPSQYPSRPWS